MSSMIITSMIDKQGILSNIGKRIAAQGQNVVHLIHSQRDLILEVYKKSAPGNVKKIGGY